MISKIPTIMLKYVTTKHFKTVVLTGIVLLMVLMLADSLELSRKLASKNVPDTLVLKMMALKAPTMFLEILPFSVLIGTLVCFSSFAKTSELVAIRASGVSAWQFLLPAAFSSFLIGVTAILFINPLAAYSQKRYEMIEAKLYPEKVHGVIGDDQELWLAYQENDRSFLLYAQEVLNAGNRLEDVSVSVSGLNHEFIKRYDAEYAYLDTSYDQHAETKTQNVWVLENVKELKKDQRSKPIEKMIVPTQMTLDKIQVGFSSPLTVSIYDLQEYMSSLKSAGFSVLEHEVRLLSILCLPFLCIAMFILAAPFALHFSRKGGVGKLLLSGLCFGFVFYMFNNIVLTLAQAGRLNLYIAVIIPIIIAGLIGLYMLLHFREE